MAWLQVLGPLEKGLRSAAELGAWQLISPVDARGRVLLVDGLHEIQDEVSNVFNHKPSVAHATYASTHAMLAIVVCHIPACISCKKAAYAAAAVPPCLPCSIGSSVPPGCPTRSSPATSDGHWRDMCRLQWCRHMRSRR